jgi:hypothetical protein
MKTKTHIIYEGPSLFDGSPIVVLFQSGSTNSKTGNMAQTFILTADLDPLTANRTGKDRAICGDCIHMGIPNNNAKGQATKRTCYVTLAHAPLGKWKVYIKGGYASVSGHDAIAPLGEGQVIRLGTYGDPASVPQYVWDSLLSRSRGHTAYTHGEINPSPNTIMTSADSLPQAQQAWQRGERTFRVLSDVASLNKGEILCPASEEAGRKATCLTCKLCAGSSVRSPKSVAIVAHGTSKRAAKQLIAEGV